MTKPRPTKSASPYMPAYNKSYKDFFKAVKVGHRVNLKMRVLNRNKSGYELEEISGVVLWLNINSILISEREYAIPFFAIHDWEILTA